MIKKSNEQTTHFRFTYLIKWTLWEPSTNQYRLLLTQFHQVPTSTALYWHSTNIYQPVPFFTDPVPPRKNQYRLLLTLYNQVPTSTTFYWSSTTKYQPVPLHTDPVPPSINQYQPILLLLWDYRLLHSYPGSCSIRRRTPQPPLVDIISRHFLVVGCDGYKSYWRLAGLTNLLASSVLWRTYFHWKPSISYHEPLNMWMVFE